MIYDSLDNHLAPAGSIDTAAVPLGFYVTWCANLGLLAADFAAQHEQLVLRARYREIKCAELLIAGCAGELSSDMLNPAGQKFTSRYYPQYLADFRSVFGDDVYAVEDSWENYDLIAAVLTRHYMGKRRHAESAGRSEAAEKRWWQVWR